MLTKAISRNHHKLTQSSARCFAAGNSAWTSMTQAPADPIMGLNVSFQQDQSPNKQNLGIGAYRDDNGKPYILPCVKAAEERILKNGMDHEYSGIDGIPTYRRKS